MNSDDIVTGSLHPKRVIVVGGGAVGCEFASYFRDLGAETTIVEMLPALGNDRCPDPCRIGITPGATKRRELFGNLGRRLGEDHCGVIHDRLEEGPTSICVA